jgi:hypothetical protein
MTIILLFAVALFAGVIVRSRWALFAPVGIGIAAAVAVVAAGSTLGDTPIPFLVVTCTLIMAGGQGLRSQRESNSAI